MRQWRDNPDGSHMPNSIGYRSVAVVGTIAVAKMPTLMEYAFLGLILGGDSLCKIQSLL